MSNELHETKKKRMFLIIQFSISVLIFRKQKKNIWFIPLKEMFSLKINDSLSITIQKKEEKKITYSSVTFSTVESSLIIWNEIFQKIRKTELATHVNTHSHFMSIKQQMNPFNLWPLCESFLNTNVIRGECMLFIRILMLKAYAIRLATVENGKRKQNSDMFVHSVVDCVWRRSEKRKNKEGKAFSCLHAHLMQSIIPLYVTSCRIFQIVCSSFCWMVSVLVLLFHYLCDESVCSNVCQQQLNQCGECLSIDVALSVHTAQLVAHMIIFHIHDDTETFYSIILQVEHSIWK